jgi:hemerythrin-like domain-containing protein
MTENVAADDEQRVSVAGQQSQQLLLGVHNHLRDELEQLRQVIRDVRRGAAEPAEARSYLNRMAMRQNYWTLGAFCAAYCRVLSTHHAIEDQRMFPDLRRGDESLGPVLDRLAAEHEVIAGVLDEVDRALVAMVADESRLGETEDAVDRLADVLLTHLQDEEDALLGPIGRLGLSI